MSNIIYISFYMLYLFIETMIFRIRSSSLFEKRSDNDFENNAQPKISMIGAYIILAIVGVFIGKKIMKSK